VHLLVSEQYIDSIMHGATIKVTQGSLLWIILFIVLKWGELGQQL